MTSMGHRDNTSTMTDRYQSESLAVLRIATAALFLLHGTSKLFAFPIAFTGGRVRIESLMGIAGCLELGGGLLVLAGLMTRPVALVLAGEMAIAYFMTHATRAPWPIANGGELAIMFCVAFLCIAGNGPGAWALDAKR